MKTRDIAKTTATTPWVDIDLNALCVNYALIREAAPKAETAAVVKCDGYGLGAAKIAQTLAAREGCRKFFVTYAQEGAALRDALRNAAPEATIYIFNGPSPGTLPLFESATLIPVLNSLDEARLWTSRYPDASAALHIDTGMNRLGAPANSVDDIAAIKGLRIEMVMSHLACSSEPAHPKNAEQRNRFMTLAAHFPDARRSLSASGGALMDESFHFDLVRPGVALYGASPFDEDDPRLKPVAALKAPILQIRNAAPGDTVGYGATGRIDKPARLATVALGYGDGFPRAGSNSACAYIGGTKAPILGRISMDLIVLDITETPEPVRPGDIAEFFGPNLPIHRAAQHCGTISYELLTGLGARVDRRYL